MLVFITVIVRNIWTFLSFIGFFYSIENFINLWLTIVNLYYIHIIPVFVSRKNAIRYFWGRWVIYTLWLILILKYSSLILALIIYYLIFYRKKLNRDVFMSVLPEYYYLHDEVFKWISSKGRISNIDENIIIPILPEIDSYLHLLILIYLLDCGNYMIAVPCSNKLISKVSKTIYGIFMISICFYLFALLWLL